LKKKDEILEALEEIYEAFEDTESVTKATGLISYLKNTEFLFWLEIFHLIMPHLDILFGQLQKRSADGTYVKKCLNAFEEEILKIRNTNIDSIIQLEPEERPSKRARYDQSAGNSNSTKINAKEVCDIIIYQIQDRFAFTDHLSAANLIYRPNFQKYRKDFPQKDFEMATRCYDVLDPSKLKTELSTLYKREDICSVSESVCALLNFLSENELTEPFSETYKLLNIIATIPMTTSECERCFSTLKRIKNYYYFFFFLICHSRFLPYGFLRYLSVGRFSIHFPLSFPLSFLFR
jgi:hypothetical protein